MAQGLKRLPPMRETWVQSLGREDPLEKKMAIHSSILAWRIHSSFLAWRLGKLCNGLWCKYWNGLNDFSFNIFWSFNYLIKLRYKESNVEAWIILFWLLIILWSSVLYFLQDKFLKHFNVIIGYVNTELFSCIYRTKFKLVD